jgi:uncharacterized membrane protein
MLSMLTLAGAALAISACGGGGASTCKDKAAAPGYAAVVEPIVKAKCATCHSVRSKDRKAAPINSNYDTYEQFKAIASTAAEKVGNKSMPPSTDPALTAAEIESIQQWAACDTPP